MGGLFPESTRIIFQNPNPIPYKVGRGSQRWVLLPQIAYKVLVPYPKERTLNVFQETILKLCRSGAKSPAFLADTLLLPEELVESVLDELRSSNLLAATGLVTQLGHSVLAEQNDPYDMKIGYVFYDVATGSFWDTFLFDEEFEPVTGAPGRDRRSFEYGPVGDPVTVRNALVLRSDLDAYPPAPSSLDVLKILVRHQRRMANLKHGGLEESPDQLRLPQNREKVKYLDERIPVLAASYLFVPDESSGQAYWLACHPFKGGISGKLRDGLNLLKDQPEHRFLKELLLQMTDAAYRVSETELALKRSADAQEAAEYLTGILGDGVRKHKAVFRSLVVLYDLSKNLAAKSSAGNLAKNYEAVQTALAAYIDEVYRLMGDLLYAVKCDYMDYFRIESLTGNARRNAEILGELARQIGFGDAQHHSVFPHIFDVPRGAVQHADETKELKSLLAANVLIAEKVPEHPFWRLAKRVPQFIEFLADLKRNRNSADHSAEETYSFSELEIMLPRVMYLVSILFDGLHFHYGEQDRLIVTFHDRSVASDLDKRLFHGSEAKIDTELGAVGRDYEAVRKALVDAHFALKTQTGNFIVNCSKVLEEVCNVWGRRVLDPAADALVDSDMAKNLAFLEAKLQPLGLDFVPKALPDAFTRVNPQKIKRTFQRFERGVLNTKLYAILFSSVHRGSELLEEVGKMAPDCVAFCADISQRRGHGAVATVDEAEGQALFDRLLGLTRVMLTLLKEQTTAGVQRGATV